jgi:hypothetical protein
MLLQRPTRQAEKSRGFGGAEKAWRQAGQGIGHLRASEALSSAAGDWRRVDGHDGEITP